MVDQYQLVVGAIALAVGGLLAAVDLWARGLDRPGRVPVAIVGRAWALAGVAGALIGGWSTPRAVPWWIAATVVAVMAPTDRMPAAHPLGRVVPSLAVASLVGIWAAVPDTEPAVAAACALVPLAASRLRRGTPAVGGAGTAAVVVAALGAAWVGSAGRATAVAALAAVAMLVIAPAVLGWRELPHGRGRTVLVCAHLGVALVLPRAVMERDAVVALTATAVVSVALVGVAVLVRRGLVER